MFSTGSVAVDQFDEWSTGVEDMFFVQPCNSIFRKVLVSEKSKSRVWNLKHCFMKNCLGENLKI